MKRKICLIILLFLMAPVFAKAANISIELSCPDVVHENTEFKCGVSVTSDIKLFGVQGTPKMTNKDDISFVKFEPKNGFQQFSTDIVGFALVHNDGLSGTFDIGDITFKAVKSGEITLTNLKATDSNYASYNASSLNGSIKVRIASSNNSLTSLTLSNGTLSPAFSSDVTSYSATVDSPSVTINATKGDSYQTVIGTGTHKLNYGENKFDVIVTSESSSVKTYTIKITRPDNRSTNNYLKSLSLNNNNISLDKNSINYSIDVDSDVSSIKVIATLEDSKATFVDGYGPRDVNLNYGNNSILLKIKSQNEVTRTYTINVNRKDNRSTNNYLKSLTLSDGKIVFDKDTSEYDISVNYDVTKIKVSAISEDEKAAVIVTNPELVVGDNVIIIEVKSENEQVRNYKINVKRLTEEEKMSDNNKVSKLSITNHELNFSNDVFEYKVTIGKNEEELLFNLKLEDSNASYVIKNNKDLKDGSVVSLFVISESGIEQEYKFIISKEKFGITFWLVIIGISLLIVGLIVGIICSKFINKNDKSSKPKKENTELNFESSSNAQNSVFENSINENIINEYPKISSINQETTVEQNSTFGQNVQSTEAPIIEPSVNNKTAINNVSSNIQENTMVSSNFTVDINNINNDL